MAKDSGSVRGPYPTKSRGAGVVKPWAYFISRALSHSAGNCKFKSTPVGLKKVERLPFLGFFNIYLNIKEYYLKENEQMKQRKFDKNK